MYADRLSRALAGGRVSHSRSMRVSAGTMVPGVSRRMARTQRSLAGPRSCCRSADQSSIGPRTRNSMIAYRLPPPAVSSRLVEWEAPNYYFGVNTRHGLLKLASEGGGNGKIGNVHPLAR